MVRDRARWPAGWRMLNLLTLRPILPGMAKQPPEPTKPTSWNIYRVAAKARPLGTVEAASPIEAIQKAAAQFKVPASKLIAVQGR
jgi:membrane-bound lytic murein transglycosylase B